MVAEPSMICTRRGEGRQGCGRQIGVESYHEDRVKAGSVSKEELGSN